MSKLTVEMCQVGEVCGGWGDREFQAEGTASAWWLKEQQGEQVAGATQVRRRCGTEGRDACGQFLRVMGSIFHSSLLRGITLPLVNQRPVKQAEQYECEM